MRVSSQSARIERGHALWGYWQGQVSLEKRRRGDWCNRDLRLLSTCSVLARLWTLPVKHTSKCHCQPSNINGLQQIGSACQVKCEFSWLRWRGYWLMVLLPWNLDLCFEQTGWIYLRTTQIHAFNSAFTQTSKPSLSASSSVYSFYWLLAQDSSHHREGTRTQIDRSGVEEATWINFRTWELWFPEDLTAVNKNTHVLKCKSSSKQEVGLVSLLCGTRPGCIGPNSEHTSSPCRLLQGEIPCSWRHFQKAKLRVKATKTLRFKIVKSWEGL